MNEQRIRPRKRFGQHFLHDPHVIAAIVEAINPKRDDAMVEIGPGQGAITKPLLGRLNRLDAIEIDRDLVPLLERDCVELGTLRVHRADALTFDFARLATPGTAWRVVGNLPYNISTPLVFHLLEQTTHIVDMHFLLQKEVVDRIVADPGSKDYGRLSVMVQNRCTVSRLFTVGAGAFRPAPKVESAFVRLIPLRNVLMEKALEHALAAVVAAAFSQRRKTLRNSLKRWFGASDWAGLAVDPGLRPEQLGLEQFRVLAKAAARVSL
jgi:16S rRNA (adenine1518-N6/adenine1519-N6)-dimethyltransferase